MRNFLDRTSGDGAAGEHRSNLDCTEQAADAIRDVQGDKKSGQKADHAQVACAICLLERRGETTDTINGDNQSR